MDGRTDAEGYNIIRPFFKRAYKKVEIKIKKTDLLAMETSINVLRKDLNIQNCTNTGTEKHGAYSQTTLKLHNYMKWS